MRILFHLLFILFITNCKAQTIKTEKMNAKLTDKEIKEQGYQIKKEDTIFMKEGKLDIVELEKIAICNENNEPPSYYYEEKLGNGMQVTISGDSESGFGKNIKFNEDDFFRYGFNYFPSGELKGYGIKYPKFFKKGIWYYYNIEGAIEKYESHDTPYVFNWKNVKEFMIDQKIRKEEIIEIHRSNSSGNYLWYIIFKPKEFVNSNTVKIFHLDGKNGEIIDTIIHDTSRVLD